MIYRKLFIIVILLNISTLIAQQTKPVEGIRENAPSIHAIINAKIVQGPGRIITNGTIIVRDGYIEEVGRNVIPPKDAKIWDYTGLTIYPGFIEPYSQLGLLKIEKSPKNTNTFKKEDPKQINSIAHWNPYVHPEKNILSNFNPQDVEIKKLRDMGFTAALISPLEGIFCGSSALISLQNGFKNEYLIKNNVSQNVVLKKIKGNSERSYPNSLMGTIALIRQTFLDANWYQKAHQAYSINSRNQKRPESNSALSALEKVINRDQLLSIKTEDDLNTLRAIKIVNEFDLNAWIVGNGHEYRQIKKLKETEIPLVIPLNFPDLPKVESPEAALDVSLLELSHWELAPNNPKELEMADISFAITSALQKKPEDFLKNLKRSVEFGLSENKALAGLTTEPAKILGVNNLLGSIDTGKLGHLVITDGNLFSKDTKIISVWVDGKHYEVEQSIQPDPRGRWRLTLKLKDKIQDVNLDIKGKPNKLIGTVITKGDTVKLTKAFIDFERINFIFPSNNIDIQGIIRLSGLVDKGEMRGKGILPNGVGFVWEADLIEQFKTENSISKNVIENDKSTEKSKFPLGAFTYTNIPEQHSTILIKNATIWTSGPNGILEDTDLLIAEGKIKKIGKGILVPNSTFIINAKGKHVTPGLIDAHSHTGISDGINEGTHAVTAEVRIKDVINNRDIAFYRELAGGLTVVNQYHGSSNPIGGHSSPVKIRWGASPDDFQILGAKPGIKFALGENVKRSGWGNEGTTRYPQTRMGVEQIIRDRFKAALDYEKDWTKYNATKKKKGVIPPRRDLELETILEILNGKRDIHSHAYRQDEILMLIRLADEFDFTIRTFEHGLEGYKVADIIAEHGAGVSAFSDWWAYKFEVYDAIPYAGALMNDVGVLVSYNSDSNELARRMNLEAAKAVKYGGVSDEEALKFVTLNPAKQLKIDHLVGSLEVSKDGDFVVWSGNPLSTYSKCEQTWIEGRKYFDIESDLIMQKQVLNERARLIQKIIKSPKQK